MLIKNNKLNRWFWRWHIIAGLITLPIMLILSTTGILYLFKADYNQFIYQDILAIKPPAANTVPLSYEAQLQAVQQFTDRHIMSVQPPESQHNATGFRLHGKGHARDMVYVNPYSAEVTGQINQRDTLMYTVRKLHGELLLNKWGTLIVEWVASWFIVLILTGLYIWWPAKKFSLAGVFTIRCNKGKKTLWRDVHAVFGFWLSLFMLIILAGGMPWTDVFGTQLKWVQEKTQTGYPAYWHSSKGIAPTHHHNDPITLDQVVAIATKQNLKGKHTIKLPMGDEQVYRLSNRSFWLSDQQVLYIDQYSGDIIKRQTWKEVGLLMNLRQVAMRLHQGHYGVINWWIVLLVTFLFTISTGAGLLSYLIRKPKGRWGLPTVPAKFTVDKLLLSAMIFLGILFPLFGLSLLAIYSYDVLNHCRQRQKAVAP